MTQTKAIMETQEESGIYYLDQQYYNDQFGWTTEAVNSMETYIF
jgi:hypothetical protein